MGMLEQPPSVSIMVAFWNSPFILLTIAIWGIARGSIAVGAEVERGTLDLILSWPISRSAYLLSHVLVGLFGPVAPAPGPGRVPRSAFTTTTSGFPLPSGS